MTFTLIYYTSRDPPDLHSFPTRRSSDLRESALQTARSYTFDDDAIICNVSLKETGHNELQMMARSEEHTSELQSPYDLVCRLLLEKKKYQCTTYTIYQSFILASCCVVSL